MQGHMVAALLLTFPAWLNILLRMADMALT